MRIAIIATARSRSTLLTELLKSQNPLIPSVEEYYTYAIKLHLKNKLPIKISYPNMGKLTKQLFQKNSFIVKILGHNAAYCEISELNLESYDQIHLIERKNFFNQCCSLQVAKDTKIWNSRDDFTKRYHNIHSEKFTLMKDTMLNLAGDIVNYLKIKRHLNVNNIVYEQHLYESFKNTVISNLQDPMINYSQIITNYSLEQEINDLFGECFSYITCDFDLNKFTKQISNLVPGEGIKHVLF